MKSHLIEQRNTPNLDFARGQGHRSMAAIWHGND
jgi:hypothetical protein